MLDDHGYEIYEQETFPLAYLLTFRTIGTWLHGDEKGSFQRLRNRGPQSKWTDPIVRLAETMSASRRPQPTILNEDQRGMVDAAIRGVCDFRGYGLKSVEYKVEPLARRLSREAEPEKIVNELKAYSTRKLRLEGEFSVD